MESKLMSGGSCCMHTASGTSAWDHHHYMPVLQGRVGQTALPAPFPMLLVVEQQYSQIKMKADKGEEDQELEEDQILEQMSVSEVKTFQNMILSIRLYGREAFISCMKRLACTAESSFWEKNENYTAPMMCQTCCIIVYNNQKRCCREVPRIISCYEYWGLEKFWICFQ